MIIDIKARSDNHDQIRKILLSTGAILITTQKQIDTFYNVPDGKLKLREAEDDNSLIQLSKDNNKGPNIISSKKYFYNNKDDLKKVLENSLGVQIIVNKKREIYKLDNIKFHIDRVDGLGDFFEVEAFDLEETKGKEKLLDQIEYYKKLLDIKEDQIVNKSYCDMLIEKLK